MASSSNTFLSSSQVAAAGPMLAVGTQLDRFRIERHLGSGRYAHVYLARDRRDGSLLAMKVASVADNDGDRIESHLDRALDAHRLIGGHPHVLATYDLFHTRVDAVPLACLTMEYADGGDLRRWLTSNRGGLLALRDEALRCVLGTARGLATLHHAGTGHYDVKPENILRAQGRWKIADLGHSRAFGRPPVSTHSRNDAGQPQPRGTDGYRSPELHTHASSSADARSDIFSIGVVLNEVLGLPIAGYSPSAACASAAEGSLLDAVKRCVAEDPNDRFQVIEHFICAVEGVTAQAPESSAAEQVRREELDWSRARHCLSTGRIEDARRLCRALLAVHEHHAGARAVIADMDERRVQGLKAIRNIVDNLERLSLREATDRIDEIAHFVTAAPDLAVALESLEEKTQACHDLMGAALRRVAQGNFGGLVTALDRLTMQDPANARASDARIAAGDLAEWFDTSLAGIHEATLDARYTAAHRLTVELRARLAGIAERAMSFCRMHQYDLPDPQPEVT